MFTAITRSFISLAFLCAVTAEAHAQIAEPTVPDPADPEAAFEQSSGKAFMTTNSVQKTTYHCYIQTLAAPNTLFKGTYEYATNFTLIVTNKISNQNQIAKIDLMSIVELEVTGWTAIQIESGFYQFVPVQYRIYSGGKIYLYPKNIPQFNTFLVEADGKPKKMYTIFFDSWVAGQKGVFRWKNSKAYEFAYNYTHPIDGTVFRIQFGSQYEWKK
ncbi:MAG: hypothetical protein A2Y33_11655 [Spirochaetes bacterium GWF1_51_8]|nr:MAG: hypothetical protein A2Y33_11655 [Spirochaetes bacterium GWF1_51_8]